MSTIDYIDLCDSENNISKPEQVDQKFNGSLIKTRELSFRPKTVALKCIGLSLIRMQYGDKFPKSTANPLQNGQTKQNLQKKDIWASVWSDDIFYGKRYPLKHVLEQKFDKSWKCPHNRSLFCQNMNKITRIQWIHHVRRGHIRIDYKWRRSLKRNQQTGIGNIFEVFCVLCSKNRKVTPISPNEFIQHMKKLHPQFLMYTDYFTHFQHCYICNDETKSFQQNITHRQMCITAVNNDPNQAGTINFNNCFINQLRKSIVSVEMENFTMKSFNQKLKSFNSFKRTALYYWLSRKKNYFYISSVLRNDSRKSVVIASNGNYNQDKNPIVYNGISGNSLTSQIEENQNLLYNSTSSVISISERIPPGSMINNSIANDRFFVPIPFPLRNDSNVKKAYSDWCKLVGPNSKIPKVSPLYCELCNAMLKSKNTAYHHIKMCHSNVHFADNQCKSCDKRFMTIQGYKMHFKATKRCSVARKCGICGQSISINDIYSHLHDSHKNNFEKVLQLTSCLICRDNITDVSKHLFDAHGISNVFNNQRGVVSLIGYRNRTLFSCMKCSLTFVSEIELRNHAINRQHFFECPKCPDMKFYLFWELANHNNSLHLQDEINLTCEICSQMISNPNVQQLKFNKPSDKVSHFLEEHNSNCTVLLNKIDINLDSDL